MSYGVHPYLVDFARLAAQPTAHLGGYALRDLIRSLGGRMGSNAHWSSMRMAWFDEVDGALAAVGSDLRLMSSFMRGSPVPFVYPDDFPMVGHIRPDEVAPLGAQLDAVLPSLRRGQARDAVAEVREWLSDARRGEGIVTFYH